MHTRVRRGARAGLRGQGALRWRNHAHERGKSAARSPVHRAAAPGKMALTIGPGDRLGLAGAGHISAIRGFQAWPVLAQQSMRELTLTVRTYADVIDASTWAVFAAGYREPWGADGDHLKTEDQVRTRGQRAAP